MANEHNHSRTPEARDTSRPPDAHVRYIAFDATTGAFVRQGVCPRGTVHVQAQAGEVTVEIDRVVRPGSVKLVDGAVVELPAHDFKFPDFLTPNAAGVVTLAIPANARLTLSKGEALSEVVASSEAPVSMTVPFVGRSHAVLYVPGYKPVSAVVTVQTLKDAKDKARHLITTKRGGKLADELAYKGNRYDFDEASQVNFLFAGLAALAAKTEGKAFSLQWVDRDNVARTLTGDDLIAMAKKAQERRSDAFLEARAAKQTVADAQSVQEIDAVIRDPKT